MPGIFLSKKDYANNFSHDRIKTFDLLILSNSNYLTILK